MKIFEKHLSILFLLSFILLAFPCNSQKLPGTRQIHLDFHTSEHLPDIGASFSKEQFQEALQTAHVNLINIFAKGHHSWSYYPTKVGMVHPNLDFDLLGSQIEACHEIGVECPIYFTIGWSSNDAEMHPEWCARKKDGSYVGNFNSFASQEDPMPGFHWKLLCPSGDYHEHIKKQVEEICGMYDVDGFWFDIFQISHGCWCANCKSSMTEKGINMDDKKAVVAHFADVYLAHMKDLKALVMKHHPDAYVYFNGTTRVEEDRKENLMYRLFRHNTVQDLEDLPTGWGGYDKFPVRSKYYLSRGYPVTAMSGKFHTAWGEFGGFKHPDAIEYEAASMVAFGAACNFGDQLHPSGLMDMETYRNIGQAYKYVEKIEEYGQGGLPAADLGLWMQMNGDPEMGTSQMLLELQIDFNIAHSDNLGDFKALIVPSRPVTGKENINAIQKYIDQGGKVIFMAQGAMNGKQSDFVFDVGAGLLGPAAYDIDYTKPVPSLGKELVQSPSLNYIPAFRTKPEEGTEVLARIYEPYFSRTYGHYTSHQNTPNQMEPAAHPALIRSGNIVFAANPLDLMYYRRSARVHRDLFEKALLQVYPDPRLKVNLPSSGRVNLLHQPDENRYVAHLLYATPHYRGDLLLIEDLVPLYDVEVRLKVDERIKKATLIPDNKQLKFTREGDYVKVMVPKFRIHCGVVFDY